MNQQAQGRAFGLGAIALLVIGLVLLVVIGLFAASAAFSTSTASGSLESGRRVMIYSGSPTIDSKFEGDTATIETDGLTIVVEPEELIVDGQSVKAIEATVQRVEIYVRGGRVEFLVDGERLPVVE